MSPSAKGTHHVSENSNQNLGHDTHINSALTMDRVTGTSGNTPETPDKKKSLKQKLLIGGAAVAVIAAAATGFGINASNSGAKPPVATESSAPANPTEEAPADSEVWYETLNVTPTAEDIIIDATTVTPEDLPSVYFNDRLTVWLNSGYSPDFAQGIKEDDNFQATAAEVASQYDKLFTENMIATEHSTDVDQFVANIAQGHSSTIYLSARTSFPEQSRLDKVPYMVGERLDSIEEFVVAEDGSVTFIAHATEYNNSDQNGVDEDPKITGDFSEKTLTQRLKFVIEDGKYKLADIQTL